MSESTPHAHGPQRTIWWESSDLAEPVVGVIDQRALPHDLQTATWSTVEEAAEGIRDMTVRGAPLIGVAAAHGLALAMAAAPGSLDEACELLAGTRPTAVNLTWAIERCRRLLAPLSEESRPRAAMHIASTMADADVAACRAIGEAGATLITSIYDRTGETVNVLTHCNAGMLACVEWGTATAPVYVAHEWGVPLHVWVSETRPRNQGALTAWELDRAGVPNTYVVDNAAGHLLARGEVDLVITGADRVAANGDSANKIGTSLKAFAARHHQVPFHVAMPASTYDADASSGDAIEIEERSPDEVLRINDTAVTAPGTETRNWGFDVTPADLVTSWITDHGVMAVVDLPRLGELAAALDVDIDQLDDDPPTGDSATDDSTTDDPASQDPAGDDPANEDPASDDPA